MDRRKVYKVPRVVDNKVKEINDLIRWVQDKDNIVGGYFGSTYYSYLNFKKPITIRNQFVYIEYHDGGKLVKERYNFNKETGFNSLEELKWELSRILRAYRKAKKDYDTKGYFQKGGSLKGSKKKPRVAKEQKGRSFEDAWGRFKKDIRDNTTPRKMAKGGSTNRKGRKETSFKQDVISDVEQAKRLMDKGFYLVENNTALEHKEGGYKKISKRVSGKKLRKKLRSKTLRKKIR